TSQGCFSVSQIQIKTIGGSGGSGNSSSSSSSLFNWVRLIVGPYGSEGYVDGVGSGGQNYSSRFYTPTGLATDGTYIYVADSGNHTIRRITIATGDTTTVAGSPGLSGFVSGSSSVARFSTPSDVAYDGAGLLYVTDTSNHAIRTINLSTGQVSTLAGNGVFGYVDDPDGTIARFYNPIGIHIAGGNLYVTDRDNERIRMVTPAGAVTTFAGSGATSSVNNATALSSTFNRPCGITSDGANYFYVTERDGHNVRRIPFAGTTVTTVAGGTAAGAANGIGTAARFDEPCGIELNAAQTELYVADTNNASIRRIVLATGAVDEFVGTMGVENYTLGIGTAAAMRTPSGLVRFGNDLFFSDRSNNVVFQVDLATATMGHLAGLELRLGFVNAAGASARFSGPRTMVSDGTYLYIADCYNYSVRRLNLSTSIIETYAGTGGAGDNDADGVARTGARFRCPYGLALSNNNLFVSEQLGNRIRRIDLTTGAVYTLAGDIAAAAAGTANGVGTAARFQAPLGITTDGTYVYVADSANNRIRRIAIADGTTTTFAGTGGCGDTDGISTTAQFCGLTSVQYSNGALYIGDTTNNKIRRVTADGSANNGTTTTIAGPAQGSTQSGYADGASSTARFSVPSDLTIYDSTLYIADRNNHTVRALDLNTNTVSSLAGTYYLREDRDGAMEQALFNSPTAIIYVSGQGLFVANDYNIRLIYQ
ncbi:MAG: hypothetical protein AB1540_16720, partial [Bdellovibrionota bacterium]